MRRGGSPRRRAASRAGRAARAAAPSGPPRRRALLWTGLGHVSDMSWTTLPLAEHLAVQQQPRRREAAPAEQRREGLHLERRAHHDERLRRRQVGLGRLKEASRQLLAKEDDVGLAEPAVPLRQLRPASRPLAADRNRPTHLAERDRLARLDAVAAVEVAVRGDGQVGRQPGARLERVDVLREAAAQQPLRVQQRDKVVRGRRLEVVGPHLPRKEVEGVGSLAKVG
mmetsp:Transcript_33998/g.108505  ORF Transcript_33998/g.108505 Transcript_33998/m.108505 type:complete len:226 (-) Transcript_33998:603-1280(-)